MGLELDKLKEILGFIKNEYSKFFIELIEKGRVLEAGGNFSIWVKPEESEAGVHVAQLNPQIPTEAISLGKYFLRLAPHLSSIQIDVGYSVKKGRIQTITMTDKMTGVQMKLEGVEKYPVGAKNGRVHNVLKMNVDEAMQKVDEVKKGVDGIGTILADCISTPPPKKLLEMAIEKANEEIEYAENILKAEMPSEDRERIEVALKEVEDALKDASKVLKDAKDDEMQRHRGILVRKTENLHNACIKARIIVPEGLFSVAKADAAKCRSDARDFIKKATNPDLIRDLDQKIGELERIVKDDTMDRNIKYVEIYAKIGEIKFKMKM